MREECDDQVSVLASFASGPRNMVRVTPHILKWRGRRYRLETMGLYHPERRGAKRVHIFSFSSGDTAFRVGLVVELRINPEPAEIMHIDLNSAFAMTEQQANPLLRGRPVGVTNRLNEYAICIAASHEAKNLGIKLGTRNGEARRRAPDF